MHEEFVKGNWVVNKNPDVVFCALGGDNALEHVNRSMKVTGGLTGITLNPSARMRFFLIALELARLADEAKEMARMSPKKQKFHHNLASSVLECEDNSINQLLTTLRNFTDPFKEDGNELFNLVTKVIMPEKVKNDLCERGEIGKKTF